MSDMVIYIPFHGYDDEDPVYISWLNTVYFVADKNDYEFKLTTTAGGTSYLQWTQEITEGYVREVDETSGVVTITGLGHLEGEDVYVTSGGESQGIFTVVSGQVTVPSIVFTYQVGLGYTMKVRSMRLAVPQLPHALQTTIKRVTSTTIRYIRSLLGSAGTEIGGTEHLTDIEAVYSTDSADTPVNKRATQGGFNKDAYTVILSDDPVPFTALAAVTEVEI